MFEFFDHTSEVCKCTAGLQIRSDRRPSSEFIIHVCFIMKQRVILEKNWQDALKKGPLIRHLVSFSFDICGRD